LLQPDEELILSIRPHWWALIDGIGALGGAVVLGALALWSGVQALQLLAAVVLVAALLFFAVRYVKWTTTTFAVTSERVIFHRGLISRRNTQMPLEKINTVDFHQSVFERIIGAGDLVIESGSEAGIESFTNIRRPLDVQQEITRQMDRHEKGGWAPRVATIPEQIAQLADLRDRGLLNDAEFEAKKAELLGRM
jgi:uncharacterized membrane protein YdbT with pleckstrin-like domain